MMKKQTYHFNLVEIVLTVAVVAFGVVIILGMLPKGLQVTRDSSTVTYASGVIDQLGGYLQIHGSQSVKNSDFNDAVVNEEDILDNYLALAGHVDDSGFSDSNFSWFSRGVFKYKGADDVYVIVMGDEREIGGEMESRVDFSGMIRVCKQDIADRKPTVAAARHDGDPESDSHECFDSEGNLKCGSTADQFQKKELQLKGATIYMELSYPLSVPYADRKKVYYSFDVKE